MISPPPYQHQHQQPHQPDQHQQQQPQHQPQQSQKHQHPQQQQLPPIKLQFLVLGAAGAGKTSILRRYFYKTFQAGARVPTIGSDFYTGRVPCPPVPVPASASENNSEQNQQPPPQQQQQEVQIRLQMWDTPGRERRQKYETSLSDSFFRQAHAIMLVYDMTSSTSFTQLLAWYADLMILRNERFLPVMIVANKLDIFQSDKDRAPHYPQRTQQRDVLGLRGGFRGKDFRYEYRVSTSPVNNNNNNAQQQSVPTQLTRSGSNNSSSKRMEISSYLANRENWTTDGSYLESLLNSEKGSHPDLEMVLLWCMRNGLKHFEVSAATGQGVDAAIDALILLALEPRNKDEHNSNTTSNSNNTANTTNMNTANTKVSAPANTNGIYSYERNQKLDLHERYAPKEDPCFFIQPAIQWFQQHGS